MTAVTDPDSDVGGPDEDPSTVSDKNNSAKAQKNQNRKNQNRNRRNNTARKRGAQKKNTQNRSSQNKTDRGPVDNKPADTKQSVAATDTKQPIAATDTEQSVAATDTKQPAKSVDRIEPGLPYWSAQQLTAVGQRVLAVFAALGMVGYGLGFLRGGSSVARTEFVYTLDESVPDSFLREDRRLLTQVVTFESDAVLTPVSAEFDLTVDQLRSKIDVETVELSELIRLDLSDADPNRAIALNRAVLDQYLRVITDASPAGDSEQLSQRREEVTAQLAAADATRRGLLTARQDDITLEVRQESIRRQIDLKNAQVGRIQGLLDDTLVQTLPATRVTELETQLQSAQAELAALDGDLAAVGVERATLATETTTEPALLREIQLLEAKLTTIDDELAERELAPLVASPIRELSEPLILSRSAHLSGLQGMAIGLMAAIPAAALAAYQTRRRQVWFD